MSECNEIQLLISAMLDGECTEAEREKVNAHVKNCPDCRAMLAVFAAVSDDISAEEDIPEGLHEKIMSDISRETVKKPAVWKKILPLAACFVLVVWGGVKIISGGVVTDDAMEAEKFADDGVVGFAANDAAGTADDAAGTAEVFFARGCSLVSGEASPANEVNETVEMNDGVASVFVSAEALWELLIPANGDCEPDPSELEYYCTAMFEDGETVDIYFLGDDVYADFGEGAVMVLGTAQEIQNLIGC